MVSASSENISVRDSGQSFGFQGKISHFFSLSHASVVHSRPYCAAGDYVKTKRALIRAVEKQAEMSEKMDLLKAELEALDRSGGSDSSVAGTTASHGVGGFSAGGFGAGATPDTMRVRCAHHCSVVGSGVSSLGWRL